VAVPGDRRVCAENGGSSHGTEAEKGADDDTSDLRHE
jgi:hypothetical protein